MTTHLEPATPLTPLPPGAPPTAPPAAPGPARLPLAALLGAPVVVLSAVPDAQFRHWQWVALALAAPVVLWGAWPVHAAAARLTLRGAVGPDTLLSLGTLSAFGWSLYALLAGPAGEPGLRQAFGLTVPAGPRLYLDVAAGVTVCVLAGRAAEAHAARRAGSALRGLPVPGAAEVAVLREDAEFRVPVDQLAAGDRFVVWPGETVPGDGVVVEGSSAMDTSLLSGAAHPVEVHPGDELTAGWVNVGGRLVARATLVGPDTPLAGLAAAQSPADPQPADPQTRDPQPADPQPANPQPANPQPANPQTADPQPGRPAAQRLAERAAAALVPVVLGLAVGTLGYWLGAGADPGFALACAVTVLVAACPAGLALATATALPAALGRGIRLGILVRGPVALDAAGRVDTVLLDRTRTVTTGVMAVHRVHPADGVDPVPALRLAGATEQGSTHPVGRAITAAAEAAAGDELPGVAEFDALPGLGVRGVIAELRGQSVIAHAVLVGRPALLAEHDIELPADLLAARAAAEAAGHTAIAVAWDGIARAVIAVGDAPRPGSAAAVRGLRALGLRPVLLTGDDGAAARAVAGQVGIDPDAVLGEVRRADLPDVVTRLQAEGRAVALIGDGVADAAALAAADLGIELGAGTAAGDVTLLRGELPAVLDALRLARRMRAVTRSHLSAALAYHLAALPLAALGLLNPVLAGAATASGSVCVLCSGLRLLRYAPHAQRDAGHPERATAR